MHRLKLAGVADYHSLSLPNATTLTIRPQQLAAAIATTTAASGGAWACCLHATQQFYGSNCHSLRQTVQHIHHVCLLDVCTPGNQGAAHPSLRGPLQSPLSGHCHGTAARLCPWMHLWLATLVVVVELHSPQECFAMPM